MTEALTQRGNIAAVSKFAPPSAATWDSLGGLKEGQSATSSACHVLSCLRIVTS